MTLFCSDIKLLKHNLSLICTNKCFLGGINVVYDSLERLSVHFVSPDGSEGSWRNTDRPVWDQIWFTDCLFPFVFVITVNENDLLPSVSLAIKNTKLLHKKKVYIII